jgi:hypothetical protein
MTTAMMTNAQEQVDQEQALFTELSADDSQQVNGGYYCRPRHSVSYCPPRHSVSYCPPRHSASYCPPRHSARYC